MTQLRTRINLEAIARNTRTVKQLVGDARLMGVVKADAYGHGASTVAPVMADNGADAFGVATIEEAVSLRQSGVEQPILAWLWTPLADLADIVANRIELGVPSLAHLQAIVDSELPITVSIKVETGMHRSGIDPAQWTEAFALAAGAPKLKVSGLFSHLACADEPDNPATDEQAAQFDRAIAAARAAGLAVPVNHLCNSAGALTRPDLHHEQVRVGLALYGLNPLPGDCGLVPALTWEADVVAVKPLAAGDHVSYGGTFAASTRGYSAVVPVGYADGLPRAVQGGLTIGIGGRAYPQVGRVCMDQIVVDLGDNAAGVAPGDTAVIMGDGGMSVDEVAAAVGTINYEAVCLPKGRTQRSYEGGY